MANYLINLSGDYNAGNILPIYLHHTAAGQLLLFDEITEHSLDEQKQEVEILLKFKKVKNHFENQRLSILTTETSLTIGIIFGFELWEFTQFGQLSRFPVMKVRYLQKIIYKLFNKYNPDIQYFITGLCSKPYVSIFKHIEETGYLINHNELPNGSISLKWLNKKDFNDLITLKCRSKTVLSDTDRITSEMTDMIKSFTTKLQNKFNETFILLGCSEKSFIQYILNEVERSVEHIQTVSQFNSVSFENITDNLFKSNFTLSENLKSNELAIRYFITDTTVAGNIESRNGFSSLILASVIYKIFNRFPIKYHSIREIKINKREFEGYMHKLLSLIEAIHDNLNLTGSSEKVKLKMYMMPENDITLSRDILDNTDYLNFKSNEDIKKSFGNFFSFDLKREILSLFAKKNISFLENKIFSKMDELFFAPDYLELNNKETELTIADIKGQLKNLLRNPPKIVSSIDHDAYFARKHELEPLIEQYRSELLRNLIVLPRLTNLLVVMATGTLLVLLLGLPLYSIIFSLEALILCLIFLALTSAAIPFILSKVKRRLYELTDKLEILHKELFDSLQQYGNQMVDAAGIYKQSIIHRKNIEERQKIIHHQEVTELKINIYKNFLERLKAQIEVLLYHSNETPELINQEYIIKNINVSPIDNPEFAIPIVTVSNRISFQQPNTESYEITFDEMNLFVNNVVFE